MFLCALYAVGGIGLLDYNEIVVEVAGWQVQDTSVKGCQEARQPVEGVDCARQAKREARYYEEYRALVEQVPQRIPNLASEIGALSHIF